MPGKRIVMGFQLKWLLHGIIAAHVIGYVRFFIMFKYGIKVVDNIVGYVGTAADLMLL